MKNTLYFEAEWLDIINTLPPGDRALLTSAVVNYQITGEHPELDPYLNALFLFIRLQLDRRRKRLDDARKKKISDSDQKKEATSDVANETADNNSKSTNIKQQASTEIPSDTRTRSKPKQTPVPDNGIGNLLSAVLAHAKAREAGT